MENNQKLYEGYENIQNILTTNNYKNILVVCEKFLSESFIIDYMRSQKYNFVVFSDITPNPTYEQVTYGIDIYKTNKCDFIISIGGGSSIDVAKCIKAFVTLDKNKNYLEQEIKDNKIVHLAIPTTAGTGSESTHFAVTYYNNKKYSVDSDCLLPNYVILEKNFLYTLPDYQKKSTMLDALCQSIESFWSINSNEESKKYARDSIKIILKNYKDYINNNPEVYGAMLRASNLSGQAINISKTTAAHAMSYKITSLYGLSHGHAVALCLPHVWDYMINNLDKIVDNRGGEYLNSIFNELDNLFGVQSHKDAIEKFIQIFKSLNINNNIIINEDDLEVLVDSVNENRLKNNPVKLNKECIRRIYKKI